MAKIFAFIILFLQVVFCFSQFDMELSKYYLTPSQLASNKVKRIIIHKEHDLVIDLNINGLIIKIESSKNGLLLGSKSYFYLNDVLLNMEEIKGSNYSIEHDYEYIDGQLNKIKIFENRYHTKYYDVGTYENGWIGFIAEMRYQNPNPEIKEVWTKNIKYFADGSIQSIKRHSGFSDHFSKYMYNEITGHLERESIDIYVRNKKYNIQDWYITTFSNGLTKTISDGSYDQKFEYEYYTQLELDLLSDSIANIKENLATIDSLIHNIDTISIDKFKSFNKATHSYYSTQINELIKEKTYAQKNLISGQLIKVFESVVSMEVKEIKKANKKIETNKLSYLEYFDKFL